ncbi:trace amine-associated receptor 3-like [Pimephales promelas]|uniref:trace amine-associated receptor 3-like n=1 Tax=Pimephales promelas TaxID=90988 RepID=UPI001955D055|nr:trace amine-associated receptor 3-like [Pimephales promelas]
MVKAFLHSRPGFVPKIPTNVVRPIVLQAFCPPPFLTPDQEKLNLLCHVRALDAYVHRAALWRKSELFVCFGPPRKGCPASKQRLSKWVVEAISLAYESAGQPSSLAVRAHSTRRIAASKAILSGVSIQDVCDVAAYGADLITSNETDSENMFLCYPLLPDSCPKVHRLTVVKVAMYVFMVLMILTTVFGNLLIIISISHFKHLQSPTHLIVRSLAACDCLLGSLVMPYSMVRSVEGCWYLGDFVCKLHFSLDMTFCISSILHLSLVSIDRYWAICDPLRYKLRVTNNIVTIFTTFTWLFSFVYSFYVVFSGINAVGKMLKLQISCVGSCVLFFNKQWGLICTVLLFVLPGMIMSSLYMKIFHVARRHAKVMSERVTVVTAGGLKSQSSAHRERKAAKTLAIVMGVFYFCWLPYFTVTALDPFFNYLTPVDVFDALVWFAYFNSTCNPLIYGFFYPCFQNAFKILISTYVCGINDSNTLTLNK